MKKKIFYLLLGYLLLAIPSQGIESLSAHSSESSATAKGTARDLAEALINDGFRVRDSDYVISIKPKDPRFLQVTLFAGNQYWFIAAAPLPALSLQIAVYDAMGNPLKCDHWKDDLAVPGARAAAGLIAPHSGNYFVKLELLKSQGKQPAETCLVYGYK
ncbi:MAG: hypothetical protein K9M81_02405 [Chthoniobacterales bacterium]|nr:hypothetical protein [Chthoniobacterales bacterium]